MLIDTHCHLNFKAFENDLTQVIERAIKEGVKKIVVPGTDLISSQKATEIAGKFKEVYATAGFHPHHVKGIKDLDNELKEIESNLTRLTDNKKVVAIGECGLDYHVYRQSKYRPAEITDKIKVGQKRLFGIQIQLAKKLDLPLVVHNRETDMEELDVINHFSKTDNQMPRGVLHCVAGSTEYLKAGLAMGFYAGVDGNVTYDKKVQMLAKQIPLNRLLLETDAPYLTPEPKRSERKNRGKQLRNEPISVRMTAEFVAKIKNVSLNKVITASSKNAKTLFKLT